MIQLWTDKEAEQILKVHGVHPDQPYIFETGFGPSGKPHFGTFGEVVRTNYVMLAMRDLGYQTKLIAFSDDMDGLRKVPENFPDWLKDYIGKPVSMIPDPFGTHESFSAHMNALLVEMLNNLNLEFEFRSSAESYRQGDFNAQISTVIRNYEQVQDIIFPYLRDETKETWFPFLPMCENCGRVGTTRVTGVDKDDLLVSYTCDKDFGGQLGCGHQGQISPLNGAGKLQWKVDWPARWDAFGVNYEMFGKDLIESAEVGDKIVQKVFKGKPPIHMFYELFLDKEGRKISKSKGTGMNAEEWLRYGSYDSLMYLMLDKPREAKRLYAGVVPHYMGLTHKAAEAHYSGEEKLAREARHYQFITLFNPPATPPVLVDFATIANLVGNVGISDPVIVEDYLRRSNMVAPNLTEAQRQELYDLIGKAQRFYDEQMTFELATPQFDPIEAYLLGKVVTYLQSGDYDGDAIHFQLFEIAKSHGVEPAKFFRALYYALIRQERGPKAGHFIKLLGQEAAVKLIQQRIWEAAQPPAAPEETLTASPSTLPLTLAREVKERYPTLHIGLAVIQGVQLTAKRPDELHQLIQTAIEKLAGSKIEDLIQQGAIGGYRAFFPTFGTNPNAMLPSPENILRMALFDRRLPAVNNLVDATNLTVLETGVSVAVYDLDKLELPLTLRFAHSEDKHLAIGAKQLETVTAGELVYADTHEVICRALNHRDSDKTKISLKTQNVLLIVDGNPELDANTLGAALSLNLARIQQYAGGHVTQQALLW